MLHADPIPGRRMSGPSFDAERLGLFDEAAYAIFDPLSRLSAQVMGAPLALVTVLDEENDRQVFVGQSGLTGSLLERRETSMDLSICRFVKAREEPVTIGNAPMTDWLCNHPAIRDLDVVAYLGVPIHDPGGGVLGALCVVDDETREWTGVDIKVMSDLAHCVDREIQQRAAVLALREQNRRAERYGLLREELARLALTPSLFPDDRLSRLLGAVCSAMDVPFGHALHVSGALGRVLVSHGNPLSGRPRDVPEGSLSDRVLKTGAPVVWPGETPSRRSPVMAGGLSPVTYLGVPLIVDGATVGLIELWDLERVQAWGTADVAMVSLAAMVIAAHLEALRFGSPAAANGRPETDLPES